MGKTKEVVLFAIFQGIRDSVKSNTSWDDDPDHLGDIIRLVDAGESVLANMPIGEV